MNREEGLQFRELYKDVTYNIIIKGLHDFRNRYRLALVGYTVGFNRPSIGFAMNEGYVTYDDALYPCENGFECYLIPSAYRKVDTLTCEIHEDNFFDAYKDLYIWTKYLDLQDIKLKKYEKQDIYIFVRSNKKVFLDDGVKIKLINTNE